MASNDHSLSTGFDRPVEKGSAGERGLQITITVTGGPHEGRAFTFQGHDTFVAGRSPRAHFRLPHKDKFFSRFHFMVEVNPPHCRLVDLSSRNGTKVNGRKVEECDLHTGDRVRAGHTSFEVSITEVNPSADARSVLVERARQLHDAHARHEPGVGAPVPVGPHSAGLPIASDRPGVCPACGVTVVAEEEKNALKSLCDVCHGFAAAVPQTIPGYHLVRELGRGGMGVVYLAVRVADHACVALKMIQPLVEATSKQLLKFIREAEILHRLRHPNIVAFHELDESDGQLYFTMDYIPGLDAARVLEQDGPLSIPRGVGLACQLLAALEFAHVRQFVHRDIKPANLLLTRESGRERLKLADFGLARAYQTSGLSGLSFTRRAGGTVAFMPPEQILDFHRAQPASDQYGAGATLYTLLTGRTVFDLPGRRSAQLMVVLSEPPVPIRARRGEIPEALADVIHRTLAKDPTARFPDARTFREALEPFAS